MKSYLRFLSRNKLYTAIEVVGLSIALAFVIIMSCHLWQQINVGNYYPESKRIYNVSYGKWTSSSFAIGQALLDGIPEIDLATTIRYKHNALMAIEDEKLDTRSYISIDSRFLKIFKTEFVYGSMSDLESGWDVMITRSLAECFGGESAVGKTIYIDDRTLTIAAVVEDFDRTIFSNVRIIVNIENEKDYDRLLNQDMYMQAGIYTFVRLNDRADAESVSDKINRHLQHTIALPVNHKKQFRLIRLDKLYFSDANPGSLGLKKGDKNTSVALIMAAFFLLISALFNYINLSTALNGKRAREMYFRGLLGEGRMRIIFNNFIESFIFIIFCMFIAGFLAWAILPYINRLLNSPVPIELNMTEGSPALYLVILSTAFVCSIIPVLVRLSSKPVNGFTKLFIIIQNTIAVIIITISLVMGTQIRHMIEMPLNANVSGLYLCKTFILDEVFKKSLLDLPFVGRVGVCQGRPGQCPYQIGIEKSSNIWGTQKCDRTAFDLFGYKIIKEYGTRDGIGIWLTEKAFNSLENNHLQPIVPDEIRNMANGMEVAGVIEDFAFNSALHPNYTGAVFLYPDGKLPYDNGDYIVEMTSVTDENKKVLYELSSRQAKKLYGPATPILSGYIEDLIEDEYSEMNNQLTMVRIFMVIAIILSALGQIAISTYYASEKKREVAIRKVFGGTIGSETGRTLSEYILYCIIACLLGVPISYWLSSRYLESFFYRIQQHIGIYILPVIIIFIISIVSVLWQTLRAARTNPVEALKKE